MNGSAPPGLLAGAALVVTRVPASPARESTPAGSPLRSVGPHGGSARCRRRRGEWLGGPQDREPAPAAAADRDSRAGIRRQPERISILGQTPRRSRRGPDSRRHARLSRGCAVAPMGIGQDGPACGEHDLATKYLGGGPSCRSRLGRPSRLRLGRDRGDFHRPPNGLARGRSTDSPRQSPAAPSRTAPPASRSPRTRA